MTQEELAAMLKRDREEFGAYHSDSTGTPVVHLSFGERLINRIPHDTGLYMRQKRGESTAEANERWYEVARAFNRILQPAYQAIRDRHALLAELGLLREGKDGE